MAHSSPANVLPLRQDSAPIVFDVDQHSEKLEVDTVHLGKALSGIVATGGEPPYSLCREVEAFARDKWRNNADSIVQGLARLSKRAAAAAAALEQRHARILAELRSVPATIMDKNAAKEPWSAWSIAGLVGLFLGGALIIFLDAVTIQDLLTATRSAYAERPWVAWVLALFLSLIACALKIAAPHVPFLKKHEDRLNLVLITVGTVCLLVGGGMTLLAELGGGQDGGNSLDLFSSSTGGTQDNRAIIGRCLLILAAMCAVGVFTTMIHNLIARHGQPERENPRFKELQNELRQVEQELAQAHREMGVSEPVGQALRRGEDNYVRRTMAALYEMHANNRKG